MKSEAIVSISSTASCARPDSRYTSRKASRTSSERGSISSPCRKVAIAFA